METQPLVSIIMPVYNSEKFLEEAILSILNQTYKNFEFIIIDDASTDSSWEIIKKYKTIDRRIKAIRNKPNLGVTKTLRKGINLTKGKFIARMDADDISSNTRLEEQVNFLLNNPDYVLVGSQINIIDEEGNIIGKRNYPLTDSQIRKTLFFKSPFAHPSVCIKAASLKKFNYSPKFLTVQDYYLWYQLLQLGKGANLNKFLLYYRIHKNQEKIKKMRLQLRETIEVQEIVFAKRKTIPLRAKANNMLLKILLYLPKNIIFWLFKIKEYKFSF